MPAESPVARFELIRPGARARDLFEEPGDHVGESKLANGFAGRAEFDEVIRRRSRRRKQSERHLTHEVRHGRTGHAFAVFDTGRLIADHRLVVAGVEVVKLFVVRDGDLPGRLPIPGLSAFDAKLLTLAYELRSNGKRGDDDGIPVRLSHDILREG